MNCSSVVCEEILEELYKLSGDFWADYVILERVNFTVIQLDALHRFTFHVLEGCDS